MHSDDPKLAAMGQLIERLSQEYRRNGWSVVEAVNDVADRVRSNTLTLPVKPRE